VAEAEPLLVELRCARCKGLFHVCESDFRGQRYCSTPCRLDGDLRRKRSARARHQRSEEGRLDHCDRQREYRERRRSRDVTDHGRGKVASAVKSRSKNERQPDLFSEESATHADAKAPPRRLDDKRPCCVVCGRHSSRIRKPYPRHIEWLLRTLPTPTARGPPT
jgi:hypothetical protein